MSMFCYQCQEAANGVACKKVGVCGKTSTVANLQDELIFVSKGISIYANICRKNDVSTTRADLFVMNALFMTITNANFSSSVIIETIKEGLLVRDALKFKLKKADVDIPEELPACTTWSALSDDEIIKQSSFIGIRVIEDLDRRSLIEFLTYGLKGVAAYAEHANNLGYVDDKIFEFMHRALEATVNTKLTIEELLAMVMECGSFGVEVMALLSKANTESYGKPEVTKVNIGVRHNPGILVSGHDLKDLEELLGQSEGSGVDIYTHSEMLPAHFYPAFKKFEHFVGNYGNAWWMQKEEFETFNGPVLFTTNCLVPPTPKSTYSDKVYTTGAAGFDGFPHIEDRIHASPKDFSPIIEHAKRCAAPTEIESGEIIGGFAHDQVFELADQVVQAVKDGAIRKFVVMAGCDGRMEDRNYYTEFAKQLPKDTVILTAGCAKYRYNKLDLGDINGIPRVLDAGQCNDSFSLAVIALKLKEVFGLEDINDLPIVYNIAWYEQKAVIVLLALLSLGVKNIHIGPTLPAFLTPEIAQVLIDKFGLGTIKTVEEDMERMKLVPVMD